MATHTFVSQLDACIKRIKEQPSTYMQNNVPGAIKNFQQKFSPSLTLT